MSKMFRSLGGSAWSFRGHLRCLYSVVSDVLMWKLRLAKARGTAKHGLSEGINDEQTSIPSIKKNFETLPRNQRLTHTPPFLP